MAFDYANGRKNEILKKLLSIKLEHPVDQEAYSADSLFYSYEHPEEFDPVNKYPDAFIEEKAWFDEKNG